MADKRIVYYTVGENCTPCEQIIKLIEAGKFSSPDTDEVDLVDISTDEGFARFTKEILSKGDGGIPSAYLDGKKCRIEILQDDTVYFECPKGDPPIGPDEKSSHHEPGEKHNASPLGPQPLPLESPL